MRIREFQGTDINQVVCLFYSTVHSVNAGDYSVEQLNVWAPRNEIEDKLQNWNKSLRKNITYVAEINSKIVGFSDMTHNGYLDRLYTHWDFQGQGIATALVSKLEAIARNIGLSEIFTDASVTSKSFFECCGYQVMKSQNIERKGTTLPNFQMAKTLIFE